MKKRILKEIKTIEVMIRLYCRGNHRDSNDLCSDCEELKQYAIKRLENCPYNQDKPVCSKCTAHCYNSEMRERTRIVMRYSGPRMILHHPIMAIEHLIKAR